MHTDSNALQYGPATGLAQIYPYSLVSGSDPEDEPHKPAPFDRPAAGSEDLPYKVELWDETKQRVEQMLAVTTNGSIGYAAFYAATREYPHRYVTLRHRNTTVARWNAPQH